MKINESCLFQGVSDSDCFKMYGCLNAQTKSFDSGEIIYGYGRNADKIGIVAAGEVILQRSNTLGDVSVIDRLKKGDVFGETSVFSAVNDDGIEALCDSKCDIILIHKSMLTKRCSKACECHAKMLENLLGMISTKAQRLLERIEILSAKTIRERLLYYFDRECTKNNSTSFCLPFSITALADFLCCDRSAMMREIAKMKQQGIILTDKRKITLLK